MKKAMFLLIVLIALFSVVKQSNAQCPTGYTLMTVNLTVNGCEYEVKLCVRCSPLGQMPESVSVFGVRKIDPNCVQNWTFQHVVKNIEFQVTNPDYYSTIICPNTLGVPPCPDQTEEVEIRQYNCWKVQLVEYFGVRTLYHVVCGTDTYCLKKITWCYNTNANPPEYESITTYTNQIGTPTCTEEYDGIRIPTVLWQYSICFIYHTDCE